VVQGAPLEWMRRIIGWLLPCGCDDHGFGWLNVHGSTHSIALPRDDGCPVSRDSSVAGERRKMRDTHQIRGAGSAHFDEKCALLQRDATCCNQLHACCALEPILSVNAPASTKSSARAVSFPSARDRDPRICVHSGRFRPIHRWLSPSSWAGLSWRCVSACISSP